MANTSFVRPSCGFEWSCELRRYLRYMLKMLQQRLRFVPQPGFRLSHMCGRFRKYG